MSEAKKDTKIVIIDDYDIPINQDKIAKVCVGLAISVGQTPVSNISLLDRIESWLIRS